MDGNIELFEVINPSWKYLKNNVSPDYLDLTNKDIVQNRKVFMVVARKDSAFVGYAFFAPRPGAKFTYCLIHTKVVLEHREMGIGSAMLEYAISLMSKYGIKEIELPCYEEDTEGALPYIKSNGFEEIREKHRLVYTVDQLKASPIHNTKSPLPCDIRTLSEFDRKTLARLLAPEDIDIRGMDCYFSAIAVDDMSFLGLVDISIPEDTLRIERIITKNHPEEKGIRLCLWKYAIDSMLLLVQRVEDYKSMLEDGVVLNAQEALRIAKDAGIISEDFEVAGDEPWITDPVEEAVLEVEKNISGVENVLGEPRQKKVMRVYKKRINSSPTI